MVYFATILQGFHCLALFGSYLQFFAIYPNACPVKWIICTARQVSKLCAISKYHCADMTRDEFPGLRQYMGIILLGDVRLSWMKNRVKKNTVPTIFLHRWLLETSGLVLWLESFKRDILRNLEEFSRRNMLSFPAFPRLKTCQYQFTLQQRCWKKASVIIISSAPDRLNKYDWLALTWLSWLCPISFANTLQVQLAGHMTEC